MIESRLPWVSPRPQEQDRGARHAWSRPLSYDPKISSRHLAVHIIDKILTALESLAWICVYAIVAPGSGFEIFSRHDILALPLRRCRRALLLSMEGEPGKGVQQM